MAKDEETPAPAKAKGTPWVMIIAIVMVSLMLLMGMMLGTLYLTGVLSAGKGGKTEHVADAQDQGGDGEKQADGEQDTEKKAAVYIPLEPAFVVNFEGKGPARFLQITVEAMTRSPEMEEKIKKHMPVLRNALVFLFGSQTYENVSTLDGKEKLRTAALTALQKILEEETGEPGIEALYFTSFVMQ